MALPTNKTPHPPRTPDAEILASGFAALGHGARLEIVRQLLSSHPDGMVVGALQEALDIAPSTLSHHLDTLRQQGLVEQQREGRFLRYRAGTAALEQLLDFLYAECCTRNCSGIQLHKSD